MKNKRLVHFTRDSLGAAIIEFAVVAPLVFLMLMGLIEMGLILFASSALEGATNIGARIGKTGYTVGGASREDYIRQEVARLTSGILDPSKIEFSILSYGSFSSVGQPEPCINPANPPCPGISGVNFVDINGNGQWDQDQGSAQAGGAGSVVLYRARYPWRLFTPLIAGVMGQNGVYTITATAAVRNEKF